MCWAATCEPTGTGHGGDERQCAAVGGTSSGNSSSAHVWSYRAAWAGAATAGQPLKYTLSSAACLLMLLPCHRPHKRMSPGWIKFAAAGFVRLRCVAGCLLRM